MSEEKRKERIEYLLRHRDKLGKAYKKQEEILMNDIESEYQVIEGIQLRTKTLQEFTPGKTNKKPDPMYNVLREMEQYKLERCEEIRQGLNELKGKQLELERVLKAYNNLEEPYKEVMDRLLFQNKSWDEIAGELNISRATCCRKYIKGMKHLLENSSATKLHSNNKK